MEENMANNSRVQLALSSIMFFSPLIKKDLKEGNIKTEDKKFISGYIKYGNINLVILLLIIISGTISYFIENNSIYLIYKTSLWILTGLVIIESIFIIKNLLVKNPGY